MPKFLSNIDLNDNEIQNVRLHNLGSDPAYGGLTTAQKNALKGEVIYNTGSDKIKFWNGTQWTELGASSGGGGGSFDDFTIADDNTPTPRTTLISNNNTFTIAGGTGISSVVTQDSDIVTISGTDATDTLKGIASFNGSFFTVTNGNVVIKDLGIPTGKIANNAVTYAKMQETTTANRVLGAVSAGAIGEVQVTSAMIANGAILDEDINASANIADTKLNTISTANKVSLTALDIDGATDINADLVAGDLIIVDDGAGGTNRKSTLTRVANLLQGTGLGLNGATLSVNYGTGANTALEGNTVVDNVSVSNLKTKLASDLGGSYTIGVSSDAGTVSGNLTISGNLTVNGTTTSVNSNEVNIGDSFILLNSDATGTPPDNQDAGIEIERGDSTNVQLRWDELADDWEYTAFDHAGTPALQTYKIARTFSTTIGDGSAVSYTVTHNLGQKEVLVQLFDSSSGETVFAEVTRAVTSPFNTVQLDFAVAPASNDVTVLISTV